MATGPVRTKRTQPERSAATRTRLLDATIEALIAVGWSGTSTTEVVRRAGVSRGAQVHHYPTKDDLVVAAIEHLLVRRLDEYHEAFNQLPEHDRTPAAAIDLLWHNCFGPTFEAWLELAVAARLDPVLQRRFREVEDRFWEANVERFQGMFPEVADDPVFARIALRFTFSVLDGMAIGRLIGGTEEELTEIREAFKALIAPFFPTSQGGST
jgi:AcrR family transcriptional regulator